MCQVTHIPLRDSLLYLLRRMLLLSKPILFQMVPNTQLLKKAMITLQEMEVLNILYGSKVA